MKSIFICFTLILFFIVDLIANEYTISGHITDKSGEELIGATVYVKSLKTGTVTNIYGFYSLTIPENNYQIIYSYVGYETQIKNVALNQNKRINIVLKEKAETLDEVVITAESKDVNVAKAEMSTMKIQAKEIKKIPAFMGEIDVIKAIQLMPGVQSASEGSSGLNVRGGSADQNLILLDEATVYNASHLMGFFSVFNNDAIKDVKLYKGDIPAAYGGRLSSLLDIRMKDGNNKEFHANGGIGTVSSRLTIEGPMVKDKGAFIISGRRSYADLLLMFSSDENVRKNQLYFYDLNLKGNYKINEKNRIYLSWYLGRDVFDYDDLYGFSWGNKTFTLRWNHLFSEKLFSNFSVILSDYDYELGQSSEEQGLKWTSNLEDIKLKADFSYYPNTQNTIRYGVAGTIHHFNPGLVKGVGNQTMYNELKMPESNALEWAVYLSNKWQPNEKLTVNIGLRGTVFQNMGESTVYNFNEDYQKTDSTVYSSGEIYNTFWGLEPRLNFKYSLNNQSSIKGSYSRTKQFIHLASNSTAGSPLDIWMPSSPNINPQIADQFALGYFRNFHENTLETSIEAYYKDMDHQIDFRDHAELLLNPEIEGEFRTGYAWSYGLEFLIRKQTGKFTGWISYTLSKAERKIPAINQGKVYPASYDKPHNIAIIASYDFSQRLNAAANWVYSTGSPVTFPVGRYEYGNMIVPIYSDRNKYRLPDYHRLDLSVTYKFGVDKTRGLRSELNLSVYNVYNRKNTWMITFSQDDKDPNVTNAEKIYLFPILPSVTYNFYF
ncbi:MAG TPA: TonB-dependent receptor [Bacteroidales bacterium]|nr:TonB-dependent receptor [Bacteroidales bacterium]